MEEVVRQLMHDAPQMQQVLLIDEALVSHRTMADSGRI